MDHVERVHAEDDLAIDRHVQHTARELVRSWVGEAPGVLLRVDVDVHVAGVALLDVVQRRPAEAGAEEHDHRRDHRPGDLETGVAVDRLAVALVSGLGAELE